jgi:arabinofuranan 3-O-arabinosyltransferase
MQERWRQRAIPLALSALAFALALVQRPGEIVADTKIDLHTDPGHFLGQVRSPWTPTGSLGHVWAGQYSGYLFPMGPFYALGHALGLSDWLVHRLWLGLVVALGAWGVVRLLDALLSPRRGAAHLAAGLIYSVNPFVVVYANRSTVFLLGVSALPWLLLAVHRGLRDPRGWFWPAAFALIFTTTAGGVNAAVPAWLVLAPALFLLYELAVGGVGRAALRPFLLRVAPLTVAVSLWWVVAVGVNSAYGLNFLSFTEQPGTIWQTTSVTETLRLMGFWLSYIGVGFGGRLRPYFNDGGVMLFHPAVLVASLLVPALALAGFAWTRRWRYGPWFLALTLAGLLVMVAGFPEGTPLRRALTFSYNHSAAVQFLRTTYKAGPMLALGLACLGGAAAGEAWRRLRAAGARRPGLRAALPGAAAAALLVLLAVSAWPLVRGRAMDAQMSFDRVPAAWTQTARGLDRTLPRNERAMVIPGQLYAFYRWGGTVDPVLPALTHRPVAARFVLPFADLRAADLQWTADALISQQRALPGQLAPLLSLMGVGAAITGTDDDRTLSGSMPPAEAARALAAQSGFARASASYGPARRFAPAAGELGGAVSLPQVRRYDLRTPGIVRVEPRGPLTVVDGSAAALANLAAFGALRPGLPYAYAADLDTARLRAAARTGGAIVIGDANRRRVFVGARLRGNAGATLPASEGFSRDAAVLDPFPGEGSDAQTVAVYGGGISSVSAPFSPQLTQFPEHRPFAALDGDLSTAWLADRALVPARYYLDVAFPRPRDVPYVDLYPYSDSRARVLAVDVAGKRFPVHAGWNRLRLGARGVRGLRVQIAARRIPRVASAGGGGIRELRIPGVHATEALRPPVLAERALAGTDVSRSSLTYLLERTTADDPWRPELAPGPAQARLPRDRQDPESRLSRLLDPPAARRYRVDGWASVAPATPDRLLDRAEGTAGPAVFEGSGRFRNAAGHRASRAFDGDPRTAWLAPSRTGAGAWLSWSLPRPATVRGLRLVAPRERVRLPTRVALSVDGATGTPAAVGAGGVVALPAPVRGRRFRLAVLAARFPPGTPGAERQRRAVGIAEVQGAGAPRPPAGGTTATLPCGAVRLRVGTTSVALAAAGSRARFDAGEPVRARGCGAALALGSGPQPLRDAGGALRADLLRLRSPAPAGTAPVAGGGRVLDPGRTGNGSHTGARVSVRGPAWLVLGESYDRGWRARCDGQSLGGPVPLDGFANAWPLDRGCHTLDFSFAPRRAVTIAQVLSALACLLALGLVVLRRPRGVRAAALGPLPEAPTGRWPLRRALGAGVLAGLALGFVFAIRAGVVIGPAVAFALWRGIGARTLSLAAGGLLAVVVPVLYLVDTPPDHGGFDSNYAIDLIAAHWVGVAAVVCLLLALFRTLAGVRPKRLSTARDPSGARAREPVGAGAGR